MKKINHFWPISSSFIWTKLEGTGWQLGKLLKDVKNAGKKLIIILIFSQKVIVPKVDCNYTMYLEIWYWKDIRLEYGGMAVKVHVPHGNLFIENILSWPISPSFIQTKPKKLGDNSINMNNGKKIERYQKRWKKIIIFIFFYKRLLLQMHWVNIP